VGPSTTTSPTSTSTATPSRATSGR
jgi:hypothetical protein